MASASTDNYPYFILVVMSSGKNIERAKIPPRFSQMHMKDDNQPIADLYLDGLPDVPYFVEITPQGSDKWFDGHWTTFVNRVSNGQGRMVLWFHYRGNMTFIVRRFDVNGWLMLGAPKPPFGFVVDQSMELTGILDSFMSDIWDRKVTVPIVRRGSLHDKLVADGVPGRCELRWETIPSRRWTVHMTGKKELTFGSGWDRYQTDAGLDDSLCCVFTRIGRLCFSVQVFNIKRGILSMNLSQAGLSRTLPDVKTEDEASMEEEAAVGADVGGQLYEPDMGPYGELPQRELVHTGWAGFRSGTCKIQQSHGAFRSDFARSLFGDDERRVIKVQKSNGRVWRIKVVPSNTTHVLSAGYTKMKDALGLPVHSTIRLHVVTPTLLVFE